MCSTKEGLELTRVSLVDSNQETIYGKLNFVIPELSDHLTDTFVLPFNEILNYNTQYSGITEETLAGVTKRMEDVQEDILNLISSDTVSYCRNDFLFGSNF